MATVATDRPAWLRYATATLAIAIGWLARTALTPVIGPTALPFIFFFPGVALSAWLGRWDAGVFAAALSSFLASWFFFEPIYALSPRTTYDFVAIGAFLISCGFIVGAIELMHVARRRLDDAAAEQRAADLVHARLAAIVANSGDAILTKTLEGIITSWNAGAERLFGYRAEETVGQSVTKLIPPDLQHEEPEILDRLRHGQPVERRETIRMTKDGRRLPVLLSVSPLRDREGRVVGASKLVHDMTAEVAAREAMRREKELLATTLASIGDGVIVTDARGRVTSLNGQAEALTGWTHAEAQGRDLGSVFMIVNEQSRKPAENPVHKVLEHGTIVGLANHTVLLARDGVERSIDDSAAPIRDADGTLVGVVLVFRDITSRRQAERLVQQAERRKDEFLAILSHELRNPLAPIRMAIGLLKQEGLTEAKVQELHSVIDRQSQQLTRLLDDLLDINRIASGKIALKTSRMPLAVAVSDAVEAVRPYVESRSHSLDIDVERDAVDVEGDRARLAQVFTNLLNNAAKYTEEGGRITLTLRREGPEAVVRVRDTGIGLTPPQLPRIFEMFAQVDQSLERGRGGLGVGLALSRTLIELHYGRIEANSEGLGRGSEFVVRLPALAPAAAVPAAAATEASREPSRRGLRVLIADDNIDAVTVLAGALKLAGHVVHSAHDGSAALAAVDDFQPHLAIIDIGMPKLNGYEVARKLRERFGRNIVLVALTGWGQDEDRRRALGAGFDHHLTKPMDIGELRRILYARSDQT